MSDGVTIPNKAADDLMLDMIRVRDAEIERLELEVKNWRQASDLKAAEIERLRGDKAELLAALKPLAAISLWQDYYHDGPDMLNDTALSFYFTPDQVRTARAIIFKMEGE